jgi:DNA-binding beta-propeller fold protein YncE
MPTGARFMRFQLHFFVITILLGISSILPAAEMIYVSMTDNTVVRYDASSGVSSTIEASKKTFINAHLAGTYGLTFNHLGTLFASNFNTNTISIFDPSGVYYGSISSNINGPMGLAVDSENVLYVANHVNSTIVQLKSSGFTISTDLRYPRGLAIDSSGNIYTSNWVDHTISKFNSSGIFQMTIGSPSNLNSPWGLAIDQRDNLYASNGGMNTISKFDSAGNYFSVGSISTNLSNPMGLAIDRSGNLYAANHGNNTISVYDPSGKFMFSWSTGTISPLAIAIIPEPSSLTLAAISSGLIACLRLHRKLGQPKIFEKP